MTSADTNKLVRQRHPSSAPARALIRFVAAILGETQLCAETCERLAAGHGAPAVGEHIERHRTTVSSSTASADAAVKPASIEVAVTKALGIAVSP